MAEMTSRERLNAVLRGKEADKIPWAPLMDSYFLDSIRVNGEMPDVADTAKMIGADLMERHVPVTTFEMRNVKQEIIRRGDEELVRYITPVGTVEQLCVYAGHTRSVKVDMIKKHEDMKVMQYMLENMFYEPDYDYFLKRVKYIGEGGVATTSANSTPIKLIMDNYTGLESFTYLLYDYEEEMEAIMEMVHEKNLDLLKKLIESPAEYIIAYEDTSTTVLSRDWYQRYCSDYINQYSDLVQKSGKVFITHMCGKLKGFCDIIGADRMNGIDSVCPPTTGDLWAHEALQAFEGKTIIGGIEPPALAMMSVEETESYIKKVLREAAPGKNFILSTGDAVAWGTPVENMKKVSEVIAKYGSYPLQPERIV